MKTYPLFCGMIILPLLGGCQTSMEDKKITVFPTEYQCEGENYVIDIQIHAPEEAYFYEGTATNRIMDAESAEALGQALLSGESNLTREEYLDESGFMLRTNESTVYADKIYSWNVDSNATSRCSYLNCTSGAMSGVRFETKDPDYNLDKYVEKQEFSFATEQEALEAIKKILRKQEILTDDTWVVNTYYIDYETAESEQQRIAAQYVTAEPLTYIWSEKDNAYLFYMHKTYCGLWESDSQAFMSRRIEDSNAQICAVYGEQGICVLDLGVLREYTNKGKAVELLSFDDIMQPLKMRFESILGSSFRVTSAILYCDLAGGESDSTRELIPAWAFIVEETRTDGTTSTYEVRINAETGMVIK